MPDVRIEQAARLAGEWADLGSVELDVNEDLILLPAWAAAAAGGENYKSIDFHYIETPARRRSMDVSSRGESGKILRHVTSYTDGRRFSILEFQQDAPEVPKQLVIGESFDNEASHGGPARPTPLRHYYVDKVPLHEGN